MTPTHLSPLKLERSIQRERDRLLRLDEKIGELMHARVAAEERLASLFEEQARRRSGAVPSVT